MKSFREYLKEDRNSVTDQDLRNILLLSNKLLKFNNNYHLWDDVEKSYKLAQDLYKNSYLALDKSKSTIESLGHAYIFDVMKTFLYYMNTYKNASDMVKDFKIGLSKENALKLSKQNKPYSNQWEISDLENELKEYGDMIKINGPMDFYINFQNDKISKTYF